LTTGKGTKIGGSPFKSPTEVFSGYAGSASAVNPLGSVDDFAL
jgi:hypothetical protein